VRDSRAVKTTASVETQTDSSNIDEAKDLGLPRENVSINEIASFKTLSKSEWAECPDQESLVEWGQDDPLSDAIRRAHMAQMTPFGSDKEVDLTLLVRVRYDPVSGKTRFLPLQNKKDLFHLEVASQLLGTFEDTIKDGLKSVNTRQFYRNWRELGFFGRQAEFWSAYSRRAWRFHKDMAVRRFALKDKTCPSPIKEAMVGHLFGPWESDDDEGVPYGGYR